MSGSACIRTLIVDDESLARERLRNMLATDPAIQIIGECSNGQDAIEAIQALSPDLVFLDVEMPGIDGFAVAQQLKLEPETQKIPVIFITARTAAKDVIQGIQAGARSYITKPFQLKDVLEKVKRAIGE